MEPNCDFKQLGFIFNNCINETKLKKPNSIF